MGRLGQRRWHGRTDAQHGRRWPVQSRRIHHNGQMPYQVSCTCGCSYTRYWMSSYSWRPSSYVYYVVSRIFFYRSFNASYVYFLQELDVSLWTLDIFLREDLTGVTFYCVSKQRRTHKTTYRNTRKTCLLVTPVKRTRKPQAERRTRKTTKILSYGSRSRKVNSTVVMYLSQRQTDDVM